MTYIAVPWASPRACKGAHTLLKVKEKREQWGRKWEREAPKTKEGSINCHKFSLSLQSGVTFHFLFHTLPNSALSVPKKKFGVLELVRLGKCIWETVRLSVIHTDSSLHYFEEDYFCDNYATLLNKNSKEDNWADLIWLTKFKTSYVTYQCIHCMYYIIYSQFSRSGTARGFTLVLSGLRLVSLFC